MAVESSGSFIVNLLVSPETFQSRDSAGGAVSQKDGFVECETVEVSQIVLLTSFFFTSTQRILLVRSKAMPATC